MKKIYLFILFAMCFVVKGYSNVTLTAPTKNDFCLNSFATLPDIKITEQANNDFQVGSNYIFISAPAGFEFDPTQGTLTKNGADISGTPGWVFRTATVIGISYGVTAQASSDWITISNLQLKATSLGSGTLKFETGSTNIGGMNPGTTTMATISTAITNINLPAVSAVCDNDAQFALNGSYTLGGGVTLNNASYSSAPTGSAVTTMSGNFKPASAAGDQTVTYTVKTNGSGCTFTQSITINVKAAPTVTLTATENSGLNANDNTTCSGDPITFTANGADSYVFKVNGSNGIGVYTVSPYTRMGLTNGNVVTVEGTYDGCTATSATSITVTVNTPPPTVTFNPTVTNFASTGAPFVLDTLDSPAPFAADPWSTSSYFTGNGVVPGSGSNANKDMFYPDVASSYGSSVSITYTYVDLNGCKKSAASQTFNIVGGASTGSISGLNNSYCANGATTTISVPSLRSEYTNGNIYCLLFGANFQYYEYFNPIYGIWTTIPATQNSVTSYYEATFDPAVLYANGGTGTRIVRAVYYSPNCDYLYVTQNVTINPVPTVSLPNYPGVTYSNGDYPCSSWGDSTLTFSFSANATISAFSSTPSTFLYFNGGDYKLKWSVAQPYPTPNPINFTVQDGVTGCSNPVTFYKYVVQVPTAPAFAVPKDKCVGDVVTLKDTVTSPSYTYYITSEWYRKNGATLSLVQSSSYIYTGNINTKYVDSYDVNHLSPMLASDTFVARQYYFPSCMSPFSSSIVVKVNTPPTVDAGTYSNVCSSTPVINLGGTRNPGTLGLTWTSAASPTNGGFSSQTAANATYTAKPSEVTAGKIKLYLTTDDPDGTIYGCSGVKDSTTIVINQVPTISAGSPVTYCSNGLMTLQGSYLGNTSTNSNTWYKGSVGGTQVGLSAPNAPFTTYTPTTAEKNGGPIVFWIESNDIDGPTGPCPTATAQVTLTVSPEVVISAGIADTTCGLATVPLVGSCTKFGGAALNATWSGGSGGATAYTPNVNSLTATYSPTAAEATGTSITFTLTSDDPDGPGVNGPCPALAKQVTKKINQQPTVDAGADNTYCSSTSPTLSAILKTGATGITWSRIGTGGTINTPLNTTTTYTIPSTEKTGATITFIATTNDADGTGPCLPGTDQVDIKINPEVLISTGTATVTCGSAGVPLSGTCTTFGGGNLGATWSKGVWNSYITPTTNPKNTTYTPVAPEPTSGGTYIFTLTSDDPDGTGVNGPCPALSAFFFNTINPAPFVAASSSAATWCSNTNPDLMAVPSGTATSITWSKNSGSGTIQSLTAFSTNYLVSPGDYAAGVPITIDFTATTNDPDGTGPCVPAQDVVSVTINPHLTITAGSDITVCANQTVNLNGNVKIGGTDRNIAGVNLWKTYNGLGTFTQSSPNFTGIYNPSGVITSSGLVIPGSGEKAVITTLKAYLVSTDPDGGGPCKADSQFVNIKINPLPIPHFGPTTLIEYCIHNTPVPLVGNLGSTFSPSGISSASFTGTTLGGAYVAPSGFNYEFDPRKTALLNANGGNYGIRYTYTDSLLCQNYVDTTVDVFPNPVVDFSASTRCQYDTIKFTELATASNAVYTGTVETDWDWKIDGDTIQNVYPYDPSAVPPVYTSSLNTQTTKYAFANYGIHSISLAVTSNSLGSTHLSCSTTKDTTLIFGPYPVTDFTWSRPCSVDSVFFVNATTIASGYTNSTNWDMRDLSNNDLSNYKSGTTNTSLNPNFKFNAPGIYHVQLIDTTKIYKCVKIQTKEVYIVPTYAVTASDPYDSSFAGSSLNWAPSAYLDKAYSWQYGLMTKDSISSPNKAWVTNKSGHYYIGELSYLNSPCFDFSNLDKPMIVMKQWANTTNLAGAVLEATTGNNNPWVTVGQIGNGINWYNTQGIVGLIGASATNPIAQGFSGEQSDWSISRIGLSQYANNSNLVRFRLSFGSSNVNDPLNQRDGIALDSIWIGNRFKSVLLEHFTNSLCPSCIEANDTVNSIQNNRPNDVISIQYHTSFPGTDNMNIQNTSDPSSRVLYYGVTGVPRTQVDGITDYEKYGNTTDAINYTEIDNKALENAKFALDLTSKKNGYDMDIHAQLVAKAIVSQDVVLNVAVLEKLITNPAAQGNQTGYKWVLRKMLPDAAGSYINKTWTVGDTLKKQLTWEFNNTVFYDTSQIAVVAFVQNYSTKEVYQAAKVDANGNSTSSPVITAIQTPDLADNLLIYPVPADNEVNILFGTELLDETPYTLTNDIGKVVESGVVERGVRMLTFNSKKYAAGMYYLSLTKKDGSKVIRKVIVIH